MKRTFFFLLTLLVFLSFGRTLEMFFYRDDFSLMFKAQHPEEGAGLFGGGVFGQGTYKYAATLYIFLYPFFQLNPAAYFAVALPFYLAASVSLYFFAKELTSDTRLAKAASIFFSLGYFGADATRRLFNNIQILIPITLLCLTLYFLSKFQKTKLLGYYLLSVVPFFVAHEVFFIRSSAFFPLVVSYVLFFGMPRFGLRAFIATILKLLPFFLIFKRYYLTATSGGLIIGEFVRNVRANPSLQYLESPLKWFVHSIVPSDFIKNDPSLSVFYPVVVGFTVFVLLFLVRSKKFFELRVATFSILWIVMNFFQYYVSYPKGVILDSTDRYLYLSSVGTLILWVLFLRLLAQHFRRQQLFVFGVLAIGILLFLLNRAYQANHITTVSNPQKRFYSQFLREVPVVEKGSLFSFGSHSDPQVKNEMLEFFAVSSMPNQTALAVFYNVDRYDLGLASSFDELLFRLKRGMTSVEKLFVFYYDYTGLHNLTRSVRSLLTDGAVVRLDSEPVKGRSWEDKETVVSGDKQFAGSPIFLRFRLRANLQQFGPGDYPIQYSGVQEKDSLRLSPEMRRLYFEYKRSADDFLKTANATTSSEWEFHEHPLIIDGDLKTSWMGNRTYWYWNRKEEVRIDMGSVRQINRLVWVNEDEVHTPTGYTIATSLDKTSWEAAKTVDLGPARGSREIVVEEFSSRPARYIAMIITKTQGNDAPAILEIEAMEDRYGTVDPVAAKSFWVNPYGYVANKEEEEVNRAYLSTVSRVTVSWLKDDMFDWTPNEASAIPIIADGIDREYRVYIPASGTKLQKMKFSNFTVPVEYEISDLQLEYLSFAKLLEYNLIPEFHLN